MPDQVPDVRKERRRRELMLLTQRVSREMNAAYVGRELEVLTEGTTRGRDLDQRTVARSERDAPEVDGVVMIRGNLPLGQMTQVRVTGAGDYDLEAEPVALAAAVAGT